MKIVPVADPHLSDVTSAPLEEIAEIAPEAWTRLQKMLRGNEEC